MKLEIKFGITANQHFSEKVKLIKLSFRKETILNLHYLVQYVIYV